MNELDFNVKMPLFEEGELVEFMSNGFRDHGIIEEVIHLPNYDFIYVISGREYPEQYLRKSFI